MKKLILSAAFAAALVSCSNNEFVVNGTIAETDLTKGAVIVMADSFTNQADTALIVDGKFTFKGEADPTTVKTVALVTQDRSRNNNIAQFVPEAGVVEINLDTPEVTKAGPITMAMVEMNKAVSAITKDYYAKAGTLTAEEREAAVNDAQSKIDEIYNSAYAANKDNALGLMVAMNKMYDFETIAEFDAFFADAADFIKNNERLVKTRGYLEASEKTAEGKPFADFKGEDAEGNESALSAFVGQGKYVLVDFWASWCGPCRGEIPNLIKIHEKYGKEMVVLGVPVWDKRPDTDNAIKELGIKYTQLFVGDDRTPTEIYGIQGIPQIILFAPDGTIAKRNLRGEKIEAAVVEALKK